MNIKKFRSNKITIYSYEDAVEQKKIEDHIVSEDYDYDNIFMIFLNDKTKYLFF